MSILLSLVILQATAAAPAATQVAATPPDDAKIVCRTLETTGSRLAGKRVCMSKKEWRRMNKEGEEAARGVQDTYSKQGGNQ